MKRSCDGPRRTAQCAVSLAIVVACALLIFSFSAQNNDSSHVESDGVVSFIASVTYDGFESLDSAHRAIVIASLDKPIRKVAHASEYAALGIATLVALDIASRRRRRLADAAAHGRHGKHGVGRPGDGWPSRMIATMRGRAGLALAACFLYSCTDEFHQLFSAGRTASFGDCLIDTLGAAMGILVAIGVMTLVHGGRKAS